MGELIAFGMQIGTPPRASTIRMNPTKSTTTNPSMRTPVSDSTVLMAQAAADAVSPPVSAPMAKAALKRSLCGLLVVPFVMAHEGICTCESRGIDTSSTRFRFAAMCSTIVVSLRIPATEPPIAPFAPSRTSEPMSRIVTGEPLFGSFGSCVALDVGRSVPSRSVTSAAAMFPWKRE